MSTHRKRPLGRVCLMALALAALFLLSFVWGRYDVPLGEVVRILLSRLFPLTQTWTDNMAIAVHNVRLPRILMACLVGCACPPPVPVTRRCSRTPWPRRTFWARPREPASARRWPSCWDRAAS